jgi:3-dehydroquinate dehydratase / shikimate dehydrogenase
METPVVLKTKRLVLRPWKEEDFEPFAHMNADPRVMEFFPSTLKREESDQLAQRWSSTIEGQGWGFWAAGVPGVADFIGIIGICQVPSNYPCAPAVEIGWRLAYDFWGKGYAVEGARAALEFGFHKLQLGEIVSFTAVQNLRSRRVMEKLGMHHKIGDEFDHPKLAAGHHLGRQVLYRIHKK